MQSQVSAGMTRRSPVSLREEEAVEAERMSLSSAEEKTVGPEGEARVLVTRLRLPERTTVELRQRLMDTERTEETVSTTEVLLAQAEAERVLRALRDLEARDFYSISRTSMRSRLSTDTEATRAQAVRGDSRERTRDTAVKVEDRH